MKQVTALLSFASITLLLGCTAEPAEADGPVSASGSSIINGVETTDYPAIVALVGRKPGEEKVALCTATVVAPTVLLTAAHCVAPSVVGEGLVFKAALGHALTSAATAGPIVDVASVHWHPGFNAGAITSGNDIAVAILAQPLEVTPYKINRAPLPALSSARLVGYGANNGQQQTGAGIKRTAEVPVTSVNAKFVVTGTFYGTTMCQGDSGGPVLGKINGEDTVIGVNSYGFIQCLGSGNSTRVDSYLTFLDAYLPQP
jgi:secreted trypsin-like serine protease